MAITTVDGLISGSQGFSRYFYKAPSNTGVIGRPQSYWSFGGIPGPGSYDTTLNGVTLSQPVNGQIPFTDPTGGNTMYIHRFSGGFVNGGAFILCDRLWHNGGFTITINTAQNITSPTWPARDMNGATSGAGVFLAVEVSAQTGAGTPTITVSYTNSAGTSGRTGTNSFATAANSTIGTMYPIGLQAGDVGVQSVQSLTLSATWTSGTINLVAYRPILFLDTLNTYGATSVDAVTGGLPAVYAGSVLYPVTIPSNTTGGNCFGTISFTQG